MEYVDALPLSVVMQREHRLEWGPALAIARQIAAALACAHDAHVIHRDVKPANILLDDDRHAFVMDFGIAKILTVDDNLTVDGTRLGTPHYMAPERCKTGEVTAASDLYSLGVLTFQMLTGRLPYEASTPVEMVQRIVSQPPARVRKFAPEVPEDVERLVAWLMEMDPKHRPGSGHAACDAIDRVLAGRPLDVNEARTVVAIESFRKDLASNTPSNKTTVSDEGRKTRRLRNAIAIAVCFAALAFGVLGWRAARPAATPVTLQDPRAWSSTANLATFSGEGTHVTLAELQLPGYTIRSIAPAGGDGTVAVLLEQPGRGKQTMCVVSPAAKQASVRFVSNDTAQFALLASAAGTTGSLFDGYGLVRTGSETALVSLRDPAAPTALSILKNNGPAAIGMHPNGAEWTESVVDADGNASLVATTLAAGQGVPRTIASPGARIAQVQYSPDGQAIAYLRETGAGTFALHVVPATGAALEPAPLREGRIALGPGALNADASMVLIGIERADGAPTIEAVSVRDARTIAVFDGALRAAWHTPAGNVIVTAPDRKGAVQVWCANADVPDRREQLTFLDRGADRAMLVSADGSWATTFAAEAKRPSVVFVRTAK
ncbi:MAG: serine/threonine protein kinase, partial [Candidatus Hydrogenedentes bacterium]|nr:serine/threonine protein kinase [Candidatus Hydrogenedentota bacterium]